MTAPNVQFLVPPEEISFTSGEFAIHRVHQDDPDRGFMLDLMFYGRLTYTRQEGFMAFVHLTQDEEWEWKAQVVADDPDITISPSTHEALCSALIPWHQKRQEAEKEAERANQFREWARERMGLASSGSP